MRIGQGYDVHRLVKGRPLILGGIRIDYPLGLEGHSDADVLCHAIGDALLGAGGLSDLGTHFPDTDPQFKGASSLDLLRHIKGLLTQKGLAIVNVDATLLSEKPKIAPFRQAMCSAVATALEIEETQLNIKATTCEKMGFVGRGDGMAAMAVALVGPQRA